METATLAIAALTLIVTVAVWYQGKVNNKEELHISSPGYLIRHWNENGFPEEVELCFLVKNTGNKSLVIVGLTVDFDDGTGLLITEPFPQKIDRGEIMRPAVKFRSANHKIRRIFVSDSFDRAWDVEPSSLPEIDKQIREHLSMSYDRCVGKLLKDKKTKKLIQENLPHEPPRQSSSIG